MHFVSSIVIRLNFDRWNIKFQPRILWFTFLKMEISFTVQLFLLIVIAVLTKNHSRASLLYSPGEKKLGKCQNGSCSKKTIQYDWVEWKDMNKIKYLTQLTFSSILSTIISHPLHVICMRQQVIPTIILFGWIPIIDIYYFRLILVHLMVV